MSVAFFNVHITLPFARRLLVKCPDENFLSELNFLIVETVK